MINPKETLIFPITKPINEAMASGAIVPKAKHKLREIGNKRLKPTTAAVRPIPLVMMKISLNSTSKLEVRNLKRKLTAELEKVRTLINRLEPVPDKTSEQW